MTSISPSPRVFSTVGLPLATQAELWDDECRNQLISLRCRTLGETNLETTMISLQFDRLRLARVSGKPHLVERTSAAVRHEPADAISMYITLAGEAFFYHEDGVLTVAPGQLVVCDADRSFMRGFSQDLEELDIQIPRSLFRELTGLETIEEPIVMDFAKGRLDARTLVRLVGRAVREVGPQPLDDELVTRFFARLVGGRHDDLGDVHLATAQAFIEENLADSRLTASRIAGVVGVSERHLSRVFSGAGVSVPQYVLSRRLDYARAVLVKDAHLSVGEVAVRAGFGSAAHFSHAFRGRFGERPTDVRRQAIVGRHETGQQASS